ncbi:MAG: hypothetical protein ACOY90_00315 [Candidatus Zhuqueibacterota bacterium]
MRKLLSVAVMAMFMAGVVFSQPNSGQQAKKNPTQRPEATQKVSALFKQHCSVAGCHRGAFAKKKLNLEDGKFEAALIDKPSLQVDSLKLVDSLRPGKSYLLVKVKGGKDMVGDLMPEEAPPLKPAEIEVIEKWIAHVKESKASAKAAPGAEVKTESKN